MTDKDTNEAKKPECDPPRITNDEKVEVNEVVNKKLTAMSKETKARKKRKLQKPPKDDDKDESVQSSMGSNQIFLILGVVGVIIAGVSLYYQRKSVMKNVTQNDVTHGVKEEVPENSVSDALIKW